jgi:hypothetical protein
MDKIITVSACGMEKRQVLAIGRQMENNYRQIIFDCSGFGVEVASVTLVHLRSQDIAPYIVETSSTDQLTWTVTNTDTAYAGYGKAELRITFTSGLAKSVVFTTMVMQSITADTTIPQPLQSWYDAMIDYIDENSISPEELAQAIEDYLEEHPIQAPVQSVNGETGDVVITASDLGALTAELDPVFGASAAAGITSADITAWNGKYTKPSGGVPVSDLNSTAQSRLMPTGGSTGQVLAKKSNSNYDLEWVNQSGGGGAVDSVNGQTGAVVLDASDVGALPDSTTASDLGAYVKPTGGIPKTDLASAVQTSLGKADTALQTAVTSFNGSTGAVTYTAPVTSVNGQTGAVVIPVGGLTQAQINALNGMFQVAAYTEDATAEYAAFCSAFGITQTYTITNTLTHVTNSNTATSIASGTAYTGTLTADTGYTIDSVTITMGGTDITSTAYNAGSINISSVTGNLIITASASGGGGRSDMDEWTDGVAYTDLTVVDNEYVKSSNGTFAAYNGWSRTGFVYCEGASTITFPPLPDYSSSGSDLGTSSAWYTDQNTNTRISNISISKTHSTTVTVPANAKYFAISSTTQGLESCIAGGIVPNA